uniref:Bebbe612-f86f-45c8-a989-f4b590075909-CDS n=1 Tax=Plasmodiophora brassicae TaxID=37360 RepID=A0A3P3YW98_PLABS|nr:bebbe612-f86f-45c8-a989-f4b590075909-CDS [Plasmodiophora brassicae]
MVKLGQFISILNFNIKAGKSFFVIVKTRIILDIVKILIEQNYILGYTDLKENGDKIIVFFKLDFAKSNSLLLKGCKFALYKNRFTSIGANNIVNNSSLVLVSTVKGVMTQLEAKKLRLGGIILCYII